MSSSVDQSSLLAYLKARLSPWQYQVLVALYGLNGSIPQTYKQVAETTGRTPIAVKAARQAACVKLSHHGPLRALLRDMTPTQRTVGLVHQPHPEDDL